MKKNHLLNFIAVGCIALFGCNQPNPKGNTTGDPEPSTSVKVLLDSASVNVNRYDTLCTKFLKTIPVKAFTVRDKDLLEVLGLPLSDTSNCAYRHARVYLGIDCNNKFKLYFVPVKGAKLSDSLGGEDVPLKDPAANDQQCVLDLNTPCPQVCPSNNIFTYTPAP